MNIEKLSKNELQEVINLYIEERPNFLWFCSFEEFCRDWVRKCENCGEYVVLDDTKKDLQKFKNFKGQEYSVCDKCFEESQEQEDCFDEDDPLSYDKYYEMGMM